MPQLRVHNFALVQISFRSKLLPIYPIAGALCLPEGETMPYSSAGRPASERGTHLQFDDKISNLVELMRAGFPIPGSVVIEEHRDRELLSRSVMAAVRKVSGTGARGVDAMITLRFGNKHQHKEIPLSVSFIGATGELEQEYICQLVHFLSHLGRADSLPSILRQSVVEQAVSIIEVGFSALRQANLPIVAVLQRTVRTDLCPGDGYGVAYTRDAKTGLERDQGRYLMNRTGRQFNFDYIGSSEKLDLADLASTYGSVYWQIRTTLAAIDLFYEGAMHVEFGVERGQLFLLQATRRRRVWHPYRPLTRKIKDRWDDGSQDAGRFSRSMFQAIHESPVHSCWIIDNPRDSNFDTRKILIRLVSAHLGNPILMFGVPGIISPNSNRGTKTIVLRSVASGIPILFSPRYPSAYLCAPSEVELIVFGEGRDLKKWARHLRNAQQVKQLLTVIYGAQLERHGVVE